MAALVASSLASADVGDRVTGSGEVAGLGSQFEVDVVGSAAGSQPTGRFSLVGDPTNYSWEATPLCMNVNGERATLGFRINTGTISGVDLSGRGVMLYVEKLSGPGPTYYRVLGKDLSGDPNPVTCPDPALGPDSRLTRQDVGGRINVFDAKPTGDNVTGRAISGFFVNSPDGDFWEYLTEYVVNAHSDSSGGNPGGTVVVNQCYQQAQHTCQWGGDVTCMRVHENRAVVGFYGPIIGRFEGPVRVRGFVEVVDNGPASERADTITYRDESAGIGYPGIPDRHSLTTCPATLGQVFPENPGPLPPPRGGFDEPQDFTVVDAEPTLSCGDVVTHSLVLTKDLVDCPGNGLVVGADGITIDLNGHTISGRFVGGDFCQPKCLFGSHGVDNSGGFDGITVRNGTINQFREGVYLIDTSGSRVQDVVYPGVGPQYFDRSGVFLARSHDNVIRNVEIHRSEPGIMLWDSDRNTIANSTLAGGTSMRQGDGLLLAGANANRIVDSHISGDWLALQVAASNRNQFERIDTSSYVGSNLNGNANTIRDSNLNGGKQNALNINGNRNRIELTYASGGGGLIVEGRRNTLEKNTVTHTQFGAIDLVSGDRNVIRANTVVDNSTVGSAYIFSVRAGVTRTRVVENFVSNNNGDGLRIEAPGTLVGRNTANSNAKLGINAVPGVIDLGGNRASGNGNPLQCINVFCH